MKMKGKSRFTPDERRKIVKEYEESTLTASEVGQKYGIHGFVVLKWRQRLRESEESVNFATASENHPVADELMKEKSREELEAELKVLRKELDWARLQNKALNTMIDIAEEQGIRIRKKSGAKQ